MSQDLSYPNHYPPHVSRSIRSNTLSWPPKANRQRLPRRPRRGNLNVGLSTIGPVRGLQWEIQPNSCLVVVFYWCGWGWGRMNLEIVVETRTKNTSIYFGKLQTEDGGLKWHDSPKLKVYHRRIPLEDTRTKRYKEYFLQLCRLSTPTLVIQHVLRRSGLWWDNWVHCTAMPGSRFLAIIYGNTFGTIHSDGYIDLHAFAWQLWWIWNYITASTRPLSVGNIIRFQSLPKKKPAASRSIPSMHQYTSASSHPFGYTSTMPRSMALACTTPTASAVASAARSNGRRRMASKHCLAQVDPIYRKPNGQAKLMTLNHLVSRPLSFLKLSIICFIYVHMLSIHICAVYIYSLM